eukprot:gene22924-29102_t
MSKSDDEVSCDNLTWEPNNVEVFAEKYPQRALSKYGKVGTILKFLKELEFEPLQESIPQHWSSEQKARRRLEIQAAKKYLEAYKAVKAAGIDVVESDQVYEFMRSLNDELFGDLRQRMFNPLTKDISVPESVTEATETVSTWYLHLTSTETNSNQLKSKTKSKSSQQQPQDSKIVANSQHHNKRKREDRPDPQQNQNNGGQRFKNKNNKRRNKNNHNDQDNKTNKFNNQQQQNNQQNKFKNGNKTNFNNNRAPRDTQPAFTGNSPNKHHYKCPWCRMDNHDANNCSVLRRVSDQRHDGGAEQGGGGGQQIKAITQSNTQSNTSTLRPTYYVANHVMHWLSPSACAFIAGAVRSSVLTILDSGASINIFSEGSSLSNIRKGVPIIVKGVADSRVECSIIGTHSVFGDVYLAADSNFGVNILSVSVLRKSFNFQIDEGATKFHLTPHSSPSEHFLFECAMDSSSGLYVYQESGMSSAFIASIVAPVDRQFSVPESQQFAMQCFETGVYAALKGLSGKFYSAEQVKRASECKEFHERTGHQGKQATLDSLDANTFSDNHLTSRDYLAMEDIWGPCPNCIQGKMTAPAAVSKSRTEPPVVGEKLHADIVFVHGDPYLLAEEDQSLYLAVMKLQLGKSKLSLEREFDALLSHFSSYGHKVKEIYTDHENNLGSTAVHLGHKGVLLTQAPAKGHSPKLERQVRTLRERMRTILTTLRYTLPNKLYRYLVEYIVTCLNNGTNSITSNRSPREIITGVKPSLRHSARCTFGEVLWCKVPEPTSKSAPSAELCIFLNHQQSSRGEVLVYVVGRNRVLTRAKFTRAVLSAEIIGLINAISSVEEVQTQEVESSDVAEPSETQPEEDFKFNSTAEDGIEPEGHSLTSTDTAEPGAPQRGSRPVSVSAPNEPRHGSFTPQPIPINKRAERILHPGHKGVETGNPVSPEGLEVEPEPPPQQSSSIGHKRARFSPDHTDNEARRGSDHTDRDTHSELQRMLDSNVFHPVDSPLSASTNQQRSTDAPSSGSEPVQGETPSGRPRRDVKPNSKNKYGDIADTVVIEELQQMLDKQVFHPVDFRALSLEQRQLIISCLLFLKEKCKPNGDFDRLKARLVAGGHQQDKSMYPNTSSPTVDLTAFFTIAAIGIKEKRFFATADIGSAFLNADRDPNMPKNYMRINKNIVQLLLTIYPECEQFITPDGSLVVELDKALYGLIDAPLLWFKHLSDSLLRFGFTQCQKDQCVFNLVDSDGNKCTVCIHVDDLFITATRRETIDDLLAFLRDTYKKVNAKISDELEYLGMELFIDRVRGRLTIKQTGYMKDLVAQYGVADHTAGTPCTADLMEPPTDTRSVPVFDYTSKLMKLMFLGKRSRPDILFTMSYLATKCKEPCVSDMHKLDRVLRYINGTLNIGVTLEPDSLLVHSYIDASYASHSDAKGHSGSIISIGLRCTPVFTSSTKQKLVSRSSTESELIALHDGLAKVVWLKELMSELGYEYGPSVMFQDNKSTITLAERGASNSGKSKHIAVRYFYVKQLIDEKQVSVEYLPTEEMIADILTKPIVGNQFFKLRRLLLNLD